MKKHLILPLTVGLLIIFSVLAAVSPLPHSFYPIIKVEMAAQTPDITIDFLFSRQATQRDCQALTGKLTQVLFTKCPQCRIKLAQCNTKLNEAQQNLFTNSPLNTASGRMQNGIIVFDAPHQAQALGACRTAEAQSPPGLFKCFPAGTLRHTPNMRPMFSYWNLVLMLAAFSFSWFAGWLIIKYEHLHAHISHDHSGSGPQKFHTKPIPRIGGIMLFFGLLAASSTLLITGGLPIEYEFGLLLFASIPAFLGGLIEDLTKRVSVLERLLLTILSGTIAAWLLGAILHRLGMHGIYNSMAASIPLLAVIFTSFAVGGIANAINIIDGYNGLAGGLSIIALVALAYIAYLTQDDLVLSFSLTFAAALSGFLIWNWPSGRIFLGDGGAYLTGFLIAVLSVLLVGRSPAVSPWFPFALLVHPIFETIYSIYRRKILSKLSPGQPDNQHLHQLLYKWLCPYPMGNLSKEKAAQYNSKVAPYVWIVNISFAIPAVTLYQHTTGLIWLAIVYCILYMWLYFRLKYVALPAHQT